MAAFVEKYSATMREALFRAAIDDGLGVRGALRAADAGELPDLPPDDQRTLAGMTYAYAAAQVKDERLRRGGIVKVRDAVEDTAHEVAAELAGLARRETRRLAATKAKSPVDTGAGIAAAKLMREALGLARDADGQVKAAQKGPAQAPAKAKTPLTMAQRIALQSRSEAGNAHPNQSEDGERAAAGTSETNGQTDGVTGGAARSIAVSAAPPAGV